MSDSERTDPERSRTVPPETQADDEEAERRAQAEDPTSPQRGFEDAEPPDSDQDEN